jgi:hypothetical protein
MAIWLSRYPCIYLSKWYGCAYSNKNSMNNSTFSSDFSYLLRFLSRTLHAALTLAFFSLATKTARQPHISPDFKFSFSFDIQSGRIISAHAAWRNHYGRRGVFCFGRCHLNACEGFRVQLLIHMFFLFKVQHDAFSFSIPLALRNHSCPTNSFWD